MILHFLLFLAISLTAQVKNTPNPDQVAEKIYLHIDRSHYFSGDDIWFKAYVIDPATNLLSLNTNNLHVELISSEPEIIMSRIIRIENGSGNGDFHLGDSLVSGRYLIRAYTNHLRNYGSDFFFRKDITVINPFTADPDPDSDSETMFKEKNFEISFFPEGGSLIGNVISRVAFKAVDESGKGCAVTGRVYSTNDDTITSFRTSNLGMGSFTIRPGPGESYYTIVRESSGKEKKVFLPEVFQTGVSMSASFTAANMLLVTLRTNGKTAATLFGKDLYLILSSRNLVVKTTRIRIPSPVSHFEVPFKGFPPGIIRLTLSDNKGLPLSERLIFYHGQSDVRLNISTGMKEYKPREKVQVRLSMSCDSGLNDSGDFSLSAAERQYAYPGLSFPATIASWFLLESDIRGPIEEPSTYFDQDNPDRKENLDLLLLTHGWRDFIWKYDSLFHYENEIGFDISGNVRRNPGNRPAGGVGVNMGIFGKNISDVFHTETDSLGNFKFEDIDLLGDNKLVITSVNKKNKGIGTVSVDPINYKPEEIKGETFIYQRQYGNPAKYYFYRQEASIKISGKKKYKLTDTIALGEVSITAEKILTPQEIHIKESRRFYGEPDNELVITPSMRNSGDILNLLSGTIPGVRVVRDGDTIRVVTRVTPPPQAYALIFLDGIEVPEAYHENILTQPAFTVERIDVLKPTPVLGMRGSGGAINIITRTSSGSEFMGQDPFSKAIIVRGFNEPRVFYAPKYDSPDKNTQIPDLRTTICWEPYIYVKSDSISTVEFYNADTPGTISIIAEGITGTGIPVSGRVTYVVK